MILLRDISLAKPPPGTTPNFINPESLAPLALDLSVIIIVLTISFVLIRLYSNYNAARGLGWDDLFCVIATIFLFIYIAMDLSVREWARHDYDVPVSTVNSLRIKEIFVLNVALAPMMFFAKSSLFLLYYRVFAPKKLFRYIITIGIAFCCAVYLVHLAVVVYFCAPHAGNDWDPRVLDSCARIGLYNIVSGAGNLALDIFMLGLPIPVILRLQLPWQRKVGVLAIFMTGLLVLIASTLALIYKIRLFKSTDIIWNGYIVTICDLAETGVTIMCSSMPAFASFSKAWAAHSGYFTSLRSRLCSYITPSTSTAKSNSSASSETQPDPFRANEVTTRSDSHPQVLFAYEEHRGSNIGSQNSTTTEVRGAACTDDIENGVIRKTVTVLQSSTQEINLDSGCGGSR